MESLLKLSVIVRVRGPQTWLDKSLTGLAMQATRDFEVIVADESASRAAADLVAGRRLGFPVPLRHVRAAADPGRSLAGAICLAEHDYVLVTGAECIAPPGLVAAHAGMAARGRYLSGECCRLDGELGERISRNDIVRGRCFDPEWLQARGSIPAAARRRLAGAPAAARLLDAVSPATVPFNLGNASAWKDDLLAACRGRAWDGAGPGRQLAALGVRGRHMRRQGVCLQLGQPAPAAPAAPASRPAPGRDFAMTRPA